MKERIRSHRDLIVFRKSFSAGKRIYELSRSFPREEMYSLTDQVRRSSRSVSANIAEAWRKRRYEKHFCSTMNVAEGEAAETQVWIEYAAAHGYLDSDTARQAIEFYDEILRMIVAMIHDASKWCEPLAAGGRKAVKEGGSDYFVEKDQPQLDQNSLLSLATASPSLPPPTSPSKTRADDA